MYLGIDPDTETTAIAVLDFQGQLSYGKICRSKRDHHSEQGTIISQIESLLTALTDEPMQALTQDTLAVAVEGQEIAYTARAKGNPRDVLKLAYISGAALSLLRGICPNAILRLPKPSEWKGQLPKDIHHKRIANRMGWEIQIRGTGKGRYGLPINNSVPRFTGCEEINPGDWKHLMDAVGLARWVMAEHYQYEKMLKSRQQHAGAST